MASKKMSMSKADEINLLVMWRDEISEHSYLRSLLSQPLIEWFARQVSQDLSCDLYADWFLCNQSNGALRDELHETRSDLIAANGTIDRLRETIGALRDENAALKVSNAEDSARQRQAHDLQVSELMGRINNAADEAIKWEERVVQRDQEIQALIDQLAQKEKKIEAMQVEIDEMADQSIDDDQALGDACSTIDALRTSLTVLQTDYVQMEQDRDANMAAASRYGRDLVLVNESLTAANQQILTLKARLFDLMTANE